MGRSRPGDPNRVAPASLAHVRACLPRTVPLCALLASTLAACGGGEQRQQSDGGTGGTAGDGGGAASRGLEDANFNQCGVAVPLPADTGRCVTVHAPAITSFDDYVPGAT